MGLVNRVKDTLESVRQFWDRHAHRDVSRVGSVEFTGLDLGLETLLLIRYPHVSRPAGR
jgi:hypothetical protein